MIARSRPAKGHIPELDGLRAFAVICVSLFHLFQVQAPSNNPLKPAGGYLGVDVFFVLSGYLITSLLVAEFDGESRIDLKAFYARRALRLLPALAALLVVVGVVIAFVGGASWTHRTLLGVPWVILYVGNWKVALSHAAEPIGVLNHLWSLAVEEQFYLIWPLVLLLICRRGLRRGRVAAGLLFVVLIEWTYRFIALHYLGWTSARVYNGTDTHCDGLLIGCALAFYLAGGRAAWSEKRSRLLDSAAVVAVGVMAVLMMRSSVYADPSAGLWLAIPAAVVCSTIILAHVVIRPLPAFRFVLRARPVRWIGRRSYGIYLWQAAVQLMVDGDHLRAEHSYAANAGLAAVALTAAALSYRFVEVPFLRRKSRLASAGLDEASPSRAPALVTRTLSGSKYRSRTAD